MVLGFYRPYEEYGFLSNWYLTYFKVGSMEFTSMEQYMMFAKAKLFGDKEIMEKIMATDDVAEIKKLGRQVHNYDDNIWSGIRQLAVYKGLLEKFRQNEELREKLFATGDATLVECSPSDKIWGIGLSVDSKDVQNMHKWNGSNLLGFTLMQVRDDLRGE